MSEHSNDIGVIHSLKYSPFFLKSRSGAGVGPSTRENKLDGDFPMVAQANGLKYLSLTAAIDRPDETVAVETQHAHVQRLERPLGRCNVFSCYLR